MRELHARSPSLPVCGCSRGDGTCNANKLIRLLLVKKFLGLLILAPACALGQGTFVYDQQDSTTEGPLPYGSYNSIQSFTPPWGQSFTPALNGVDFIRLELVDGSVGDTLGATMHINLMSGSISGPVIASTSPLTMANGFTGPATFHFPSKVFLTPGTMYFFTPVEESGGDWHIAAESYFYIGGNSYNAGVIYPGGNLWFREGLVVPEPSTLALALLAIGGLLFASRAHRS